MQTSNKPALIPVPFADTGTKNVIPTNPPATPGLASLQLGFPPVTMIALPAGGIPPEGADFNGILNLISAASRWSQAGGGYTYDSDFATAIGGYPKGSVLVNTAGDGFWISLVDNNTADPDAGGAGWVPAFNQGINAITGLTNANVTLTSAQSAKPIITLAGTLTGNIQIIFPATQQQWLVVNGTTGAFTVTCKTAAGTGVAVSQGGAARIYGDGANIALPPQQVGLATAPTHAMQLAQATGRLIGVRVFGSVGTSIYTPTLGTNAVIVELQGGGAAGGGTPVTGSGQAAVGGAGGGGGYAMSYLTSGFSGVAVTIGSGGAPAVAATGGAGGTSSFGALLSATGGSGGPGGSSTVTPPWITGGGSGGVGVGGNIVNKAGGQGGSSFALSTGSALQGGVGGFSFLGGTGGAVSPGNGSGNSAGVPGAGGGGVAMGQSQASVQGGAGFRGVAVIWEYS
jgi:hypothetical protein